MSDFGRATVDFGGLAITYDSRVLQPRGWTEHQSRWAAELLAHLPAGDVLELCAGAGQIGLLAVADSPRRLVCVDLNPVAAEFALSNARAAGMADRVEMREGRIEEVLKPEERFPLIIADPPWVRRSETARFPEDPLLAIDGGDDGLLVVRTCVEAIETHLCEGGAALLQLGPGEQAGDVRRLVQDTDLRAGDVRHFGQRGALMHLERR